GTSMLRSPRQTFILLAACTCLLATAFATSPQEHLVYTSGGPPNLAGPTSTLISDAAGNLYGTAYVGGNGLCIWSGGAQNGCGSVFELSPPAGGIGPWTEKVLYSFQGGTDGALPYAGLVMDAAGNLYGAASVGGDGTSQDLGIIYELSPPSGGSGAWTFTNLFLFSNTSADGGSPMGTLIFDHAGNLYGTTSSGGASNDGAVFKLSPPSAPGGTWTETVLHSFSGADGWFPVAGLYLDGAGNLYGTTVQGGNMTACGGSGCGVVFKLSPGSGGTWTEMLLHRFARTDGSQPYGSLTFYHGNFYGTTFTGSNFAGTVFELTAGHGGPWTLTTIHSFGGPNDGGAPYSGVTFDGSGNLYGTTYGGGSAAQPDGTVYKLSPPSGGAWSETILTNFSQTGAAQGPIGGLLLKGNKLFGTTSDCNSSFSAGCSISGNVFAITNF
ncbi:MAG: choice-of-anchor tandem repeat GloVer-containing protein, partial [Candidatus Sulfotelmatobacter sp.]